MNNKRTDSQICATPWSRTRRTARELARAGKRCAKNPAEKPGSDHLRSLTSARTRSQYTANSFRRPHRSMLPIACHTQRRAFIFFCRLPEAPGGPYGSTEVTAPADRATRSPPRQLARRINTGSSLEYPLRFPIGKEAHGAHDRRGSFHSFAPMKNSPFVVGRRFERHSQARHSPAARETSRWSLASIHCSDGETSPKVRTRSCRG